MDSPVDPRKGEELDLSRLNRFLTGNSITGKAIGQKQFPGGYSNLTYLLTCEKGEFVLRRPPAGAAIKTAHDMGREFKVLSTLRGHYNKIPKPIAYCEDPEAIGSPFYIMERVRGTILRPAAATTIRLDPPTMRKISEALVDNLVELHAINIHKTGLIHLGKPEGYISRQVEGWTKRYENSRTDDIPSIEGMGKWLKNNQPTDAAPVFMHNDYKYDNVVLLEQDPTEIAGVLDWEMSTVGDPGMDLGASLAYWAEEKDGELAKVFNISWLPGNLTRKEVVERYQDKSGRTVGDILFFYLFGMFKNAVIAQQIYARWKQGHSKDPRFGQLIYVIHDLGRRGEQALSDRSI